MLAWGSGNALYVKYMDDIMTVLFYSTFQAYALYILINHIRDEQFQSTFAIFQIPS